MKLYSINYIIIPVLYVLVPFQSACQLFWLCFNSAFLYVFHLYVFSVYAILTKTNEIQTQAIEQTYCQQPVQILEHH